jgi:uncharacterized protein YndB with AHSA1/START domain
LHIESNLEGTVATLDITRSIDINAPADKVWAAITEPDLIAQWFGETCEFDPTPGGSGTFGWSEHGTFRVVAEHVDAGGWRAELGELVEFLESR